MRYVQESGQNELIQQHASFVESAATEVVSQIRVTARTAYLAVQKGARNAAGTCAAVTCLK
jgi:hypothetical protein